MFHRKLPLCLLAAGAAVGSTVALSLPAGASQTRARPAAASYTLETLPDGGMTWFYNQIKNAKTSIDLTMYELQDTTAEDDRGDAAGRGEDVRVNPEGGAQAEA